MNFVILGSIIAGCSCLSPLLFSPSPRLPNQLRRASQAFVFEPMMNYVAVNWKRWKDEPERILRTMKTGGMMDDDNALVSLETWKIITGEVNKKFDTNINVFLGFFPSQKWSFWKKDKKEKTLDISKLRWWFIFPISKIANFLVKTPSNHHPSSRKPFIKEKKIRAHPPRQSKKKPFRSFA